MNILGPIVSGANIAPLISTIHLPSVSTDYSVTRIIEWSPTNTVVGIMFVSSDFVNQSIEMRELYHSSDLELVRAG